jgi:hypothetical protein
MKRTLVLALLTTLGLLASAHRTEAAHPICGTWRQTNEGGTSELKITPNVGRDGTFDVEEFGLGNAVGTATFQDGILTIHWHTGDLRGIFRHEIDREHERGRGKVLFTKYPADFQLGEERTIEGRPVRELRGAALRRIGR